MMKPKKVFGLLLILTIFIFAFQCFDMYEDNSFITFQGRITDEFNQDIPGLELILGQEIFDSSFEPNNNRFEFDSLENTVSRRISRGKTNDSGNFRFVHPAKFRRFFVYKDTQTFFRYMENGTLVERNFILFERNQDTGRFSEEIKNIQIVIP